VDHRVRPARLVRFALLWLLAFHLAAGLSCTITNLLYNWTPPYRGGIAILEPSSWVFILRRLFLPYDFPLEFPAGPGSSISVYPFPLYIGALVPTFLMPAWMLLLGTSLRAAHVRFAHLLRGVAYAIPCAIAYIAVCLAAIGAPPVIRRFTTVRIPDVLIFAAILLCIGHHLVWWYLFVRKYLRLKHGAAVVLLNMTMSLLVLMIAVALLAVWRVDF
jgi:hypothetical protein